MPIKQADENDYIEVQGGMPKVEQDGKLTIVTHDYEEGEGMVVKSHLDHGTVILNTSNGDREFKVDLLKMFHGDPCEAQSRKVGGEGYPRMKL